MKRIIEVQCDKSDIIVGVDIRTVIGLMRAPFKEIKKKKNGKT